MIIKMKYHDKLSENVLWQYINKIVIMLLLHAPTERECFVHLLERSSATLAITSTVNIKHCNMENKVIITQY